MKTLKSILQTMIMLTALVAFVMVESDVRGQCPTTCSGFNTIDHLYHTTSNSDCFNNANGDCSVAAGFRSEANADYSFALGNSCITNLGATGSVSFGLETYTDSAYSIAAGVRSHTGAEYSFALGKNCVTNQGGTASFTFGEDNATGGKNAFAFGESNTANGDNSFIGGMNSFIASTADNSIGYGNNVEINGNASSAFGTNLTQNGTGSFLAGSGFTNNINQNFLVGWAANPNPVIYADLNDPAGTGFLGINRTTVFTPLPVDIDLSVQGSAEKFDGSTAWIAASDKRLKTDIAEFRDGLDVLMQINPVWFTYNEIAEKMGFKTNNKAVGIIAQEMQEIAPYMILDGNDENDYLSYDANALKYVLVNSIQEQQEIIEKQDQKIKEYESRVSKLESKMDKLLRATNSGNDADITNDGSVKNVSISNVSLEKPMLFQNEPNPFSGSTTIRYYVPEDVMDAEIIIVSTGKGQLLKRIALNEPGMGTLNVNIENVATGNYTYALILDGKQTLSRQMMVGR